MILPVGGDEPDLEMERLLQEGDIEGNGHHVQRLYDDLDENGGAR